MTAYGGDNVMWGSNGDDELSGGSGDDLLHGGQGDDRLEGWAGTDTLTGAQGSDEFFFWQSSASTAVNRDVITDFSLDEWDWINLDFVESYDDVVQRQTADGLVVEAGEFQVLLAGFSGELEERSSIVVGGGFGFGE